MRKISIYALLSILSLGSCTKEFVYNDANDIKENAEQIFGLIDPNQDWRTTTSGTVTVTADADLANITKVQLQTESPVFNPDATILAEADATAGQTVTLSYDAPRTNTRVIAACVDGNGKYYIKGFNIGEKSVSFRSSTAATRAVATTRAGEELPNISLKYKESFLSYNAERANSNDSYYSIWKDTNWENDRLWKLSGESSNGWTISNSTIYRNATALSEDEANELNDIFVPWLDRYGSNGKARNNLKLINESSVVQLYGNHLEAKGQTPITICPVQAASTEAYWCDIYYYYFKPEDVVGDTANYIKSLPKFKAVDVNDERQAFSAVTGIGVNDKDVNFLRLHEYLLPFYGNASEFTFKPSTLGSYGYTTDGKYYRIYNYSGKSDAKPKPIPASNHFITYGDSTHNLKDEYTDNIEYQLWQLFTNTNDNTVMLYNVGSQKFFWWNNGDYVRNKDISENSFKNYTIYITDGAKNPYAFDDITKQKVFILSSAKNNFIKARIDTDFTYLNKGGTNISGDCRTAREWTFEVYDEHPANAINDVELSLDYFPDGQIAPPSTKPSTIIPEGYRVGFMIRKDGGAEANHNNGDRDKKGCSYGYGELNTEINKYGQFKKAAEYGMQLNSPRMATFKANNKIYLCFEEGSDAQYSDVIVEIGSNGEAGVDIPDDPLEVEEQAYTMCFEDRPNVADYDMNDVVLRCTRVSSTELELSLIATGANDPVLISGIVGDYVSGTELKNKEVHGLFGVETSTFVNTVTSDEVLPSVSCVYRVDESTSIKQFLSNIYITNNGQGGRTIGLPATGEAPFALIMPGNFNYPQEKISIATAYTTFRNWVNNANNYGNWPEFFEPSKIYTNPYNRE